MKRKRVTVRNKRIYDDPEDLIEDLLFAIIAEKRLRQKYIKWVSHANAWKNHVRP